MKRAQEHRGGPRRGLTLLEIVMAVGLLTVFLGSTLLLGRSILGAFRTETSQARYDEALHGALDRMAQRLRTVDGQALLPGGAIPSDWVEFQRANDHDGVNVVWGALERLTFEYDPDELDDGLDNDGDGLVDEGRAVWIRDPGGAGERRVVLAWPVPEVSLGEIPGNGIDDDGNGLVDEDGLAFEITGNRMRIVLTIHWLGEDGQLQEIQDERVVVMRNTGINAP